MRIPDKVIDFLENPQNLIMLRRAVQTGTWPATRKELFELSTQLMLQEFDKERARSGRVRMEVACDQLKAAELIRAGSL